MTHGVVTCSLHVSWCGNVFIICLMMWRHAHYMSHGVAMCSLRVSCDDNNEQNWCIPSQIAIILTIFAAFAWNVYWNEYITYLSRSDNICSSISNIQSLSQEFCNFILCKYTLLNNMSFAWRQKGLSIYFKQQPVRPFWIQADERRLLFRYILRWVHTYRQPFIYMYVTVFTTNPYIKNI